MVDYLFIFKGNERKEGGFWNVNDEEKKQMGKFKFIFLRPDRPDLVPLKKIWKFLRKIEISKSYMIRLYVLRGLGITSVSDEENPKTFLWVSMNNQDTLEDKEALREGPFPEYYRTFEFPVKALPGTGILKIEVLER